MIATVYVSIGNSDDKLTQREWAAYVREFVKLMRKDAAQVYGEWYSAPDVEYQNACIAAAVPDERLGWLRGALLDLRTQYRQDSVAWAEAPRTEFI